MSTAIARLIDDPALARQLADAGRESALRRFSIARYRAEVADLITSVAR